MSLVSVQLSICTTVVERNAILSFFFQNESYLQIDIVYEKLYFQGSTTDNEKIKCCPKNI